MKMYWFALSLLFVLSCQKKEKNMNLEEYIEDNSDLEQVSLTAFVLSDINQLSPSGNGGPFSEFYFEKPSDAFDLRYFATKDVKKTDALKYYKPVNKLPMGDSPAFNGGLRRTGVGDASIEKKVVLTYKTAGKIHISEPVLVKQSTAPTEYNDDLLIVKESGITPYFEWQDGGSEVLNQRYFLVISDSIENLISGIYTTNKNFEFYDSSSVIESLAISTAELQPNSKYIATVFGISDFHWVNFVARKAFYTN
ncbi:MAG: hypothetical protein AB8B72_12840 [Crocinitomicaceae bacterium]